MSEKKVAIVTGSSKGIGRAIAIALSKAGLNVVVNYNQSQTEGEKTLEEVNKFASGICVKADVSNGDEVGKMKDAAVKAFGRVDVLVNNAGQIIRPGSWENITEGTWDRTFKINTYSVYNCIKTFIPLLEYNNCGRIINIASTYGIQGDAGVISYCASKAAVINMTISLAKTFAPNVTVNAVAPGNIDTEMTRSAGEEFVEWVVDSTPLKRLGKVEDVANIVEFLASERAGFLTGLTVNVDGGFSLIN